MRQNPACAFISFYFVSLPRILFLYLTIFGLSLSIISNICFSNQNSIAPEAFNYTNWLEEEVSYIITPREKKVFLQLETDKEKDLFIGSFWKQRDPSPQTERNEFKEEHYRRINYANQHFGHGSPLPGWKTDRGKVYILLGRPQSTQSFEGYSTIRPTVVWFYQGINETGLPDAFSIIFFRAHIAGDFKIYSPTLDGPQALLSSGSILGTDSRSAFQTLLRIAPNLARISISLIPGQALDMESSSLASDRLLSNINNLPRNRVKDEYAEKFLIYKDIIDVQYSTNYIHNDSLVRVFRSPIGFHLVHYVVELDNPKFLSQVSPITTELTINGILSNQDGHTIYQYENSVSLIPEEEILEPSDRVRISYQDMFPLIEGRFKFRLILKNETTKEFTSLEKELIIPDHPSEILGDIFLCHNIKTNIPENDIRAFKIGNIQLFVSALPIFSPGQEISFFFHVNNSTDDISIDYSYDWVLSKDNMKSYESRRNLLNNDSEYGAVEKIPGEMLLPGNYSLRVTLFDDQEKEIISKITDFQISSRNVPKPIIYSTSFPPLDNPFYMSLVGNQHLAQGELNKAEQPLQQAYLRDPSSLITALPYGQLLIRQKKYSEVLDTLSPFIEKNIQEVLDIVARSHHAQGQFEKAISLYQEYLIRFGKNSSVLALLGDCYYRIGNIKDAIQALESSLALDPKQDNVKRLLESIKKNS